MRIVADFAQAKQLLDRRNPLESFAGSPALAARIKQAFGRELSPKMVVESIIQEVKLRGDKALIDFTKKLDGVELNSLEVSRSEISQAYASIGEQLLPALKLAAERIRRYHLGCHRKIRLTYMDEGVGRQVCPLERVGIYIPGGTATYPSTVLMTAIPAKVAGVKEIIMTSPPDRNGKVPAATLVAADIAGVTRIFKVGGAQAIAALAFGTESIPLVDKICGPGNIFVTLAKKMVYGAVDVDGLQGPSEVMILADERANPSFCAADLLAQAEHDPLAEVILITTSSKLASQVEREVGLQTQNLPRRSIIEQSTERGVIVVVDNIDEAIELVNLYAPEHLSLMVKEANSLISRANSAGAIFIGENSPVALGDYVAGPSHVLPTGGSARFSSPLGVEDFLKVTSIIALDKSTMQEIRQTAITIAQVEGLEAHAQAISLRAKLSSPSKGDLPEGQK